MRKHRREMMQRLRELNYQAEIINSGGGHAKLQVTLPDGRVGRVSVSSSPRQNQQAIKNAIRQVKAWEQAGVPNIRRNTR